MRLNQPAHNWQNTRKHSLHSSKGPCSPQNIYNNQIEIRNNMYTQEQDVMNLVKPGQRVFIHGGAATPHHLLNLLADRADQLWNVELVSVSLQGNSILTDKRYQNSFRM